jgi:hypothetical protein
MSEKIVVFADEFAKALLEDFRKVATLADVALSRESISFQIMRAPHLPPSSLPIGKMAVYAFVWNERCLKVGKVGPKSQARFTSQHYISASSNSNLAKSLVGHHEKLGLSGITDANVGNWIKANVERVNFLINAECGILVLTLLESFLQCRLNPVFEGFNSQR